MHKLIVIIIVSIFFGKRTYLTIINYIFTVQVHELIIPYGTSTILNYFIVEKQTSQKNTELVDVKIIRYYTKEIIHLRNAQFSLIKKNSQCDFTKCDFTSSNLLDPDLYHQSHLKKYHYPATNYIAVLVIVYLP